MSIAATAPSIAIQAWHDRQSARERSTEQTQTYFEFRRSVGGAKLRCWQGKQHHRHADSPRTSRGDRPKDGRRRAAERRAHDARVSQSHRRNARASQFYHANDRGHASQGGHEVSRNDRQADRRCPRRAHEAADAPKAASELAVE